MIAYTITTHPKAKSLKIKILPSGEVVVVKPAWGFFLPNIDDFVTQHQDWILQTQAKVTAHHPPSNEVLVFGTSYQKTITQNQKDPLGVRIVGQTLQIRPVSNTSQSINAAITTFLKSTAQKYLIPRTHQLAKMMGTTFTTITLRQQSTRWGSCSSTGSLNFNWRLVHSPPAVIDYVIIHELAHRSHMNHSAAFWELVRQFDPAYKEHMGWLKRHGMALG